MAGIDRTLKLKDGFSAVLGKYISMLEKATRREEALAETHLLAVNRSAAWEDALAEAAHYTLKSTESIETMQKAMQKFYSMAEDPQEVVEGLKDMQNALTEAGYTWTEQADNFDKQALLMTHSVERLVDAGLLAGPGITDLAERYASFGLEITDNIKDQEAFASEYEKILKLLDRGGKSVDKAIKKMQELAEAGLITKDSLSQFIAEQEKANKATEKQEKGMNGLARRLLRLGLYFFSAHKIISYFRQAASRAPDEIAKKFDKLKENISNLFGGATVAAMSKMTAGIDKLNQALSSPAGQKFQRGMEAIGRVVGSVVAVAFEKLGALIEWVGNNMELIVLAAVPALTLFAIKLFTIAAGAIAAHMPLILLTGAALAFGLMLKHLGVTAGDVFGFIAGTAYVLYGVIHNVIGWIWNGVATLIENVVNTAREKGVTLKTFFATLGDGILTVFEKVAQAIDKITGKNLAGSISQLKSNLQEWAKDDGYEPLVLKRMEALDLGEMWDKGKSLGQAFGNSLSDKALSMANAQELKAINRNTAAIKDAVTDEDITALVDMAERQFVNNINLTSQTPIITINGANTGNTEADRLNLSNAIRDILLAQVATGPSAPSPAYFGS